VFRQAAESRIIANAHRIREGVMPVLDDDPGSDFRFVACEDADDGAAKIRSLVCDVLPARYGLDATRDIQVLTPMNQGRLGARTLNAELQAALNPEPVAFVERFGWRFAIGDKVMQVENDYDKDVFNGDLGAVASIDGEAGRLCVDFDGRRIDYGYDDLDQLVLAYATTIHKAQGSEYPAVVIPITTQHYPMLQRPLIYTGVARGRRLVVVVGQPRALAIAVKGGRGRRRWTRLAEELAKG
jgi:exodeoxyribonuclease V alpha subunit